MKTETLIKPAFISLAIFYFLIGAFFFYQNTFNYHGAIPFAEWLKKEIFGGVLIWVLCFSVPLALAARLWKLRNVAFGRFSGCIVVLGVFNILLAPFTGYYLSLRSWSGFIGLAFLAVNAVFTGTSLLLALILRAKRVGS